MERLNRGLCNMSWRNLFPNAVIRHLDFQGSDHRPLLLDCKIFAGPRWMPLANKGRRFFFEECRLDEKDCNNIVSLAWRCNSSNNCVMNVLNKIDKCGDLLSDGFSAFFYHKFLNLAGPSVTKACMEVLNEGASVAEILSLPEGLDRATTFASNAMNLFWLPKGLIMEIQRLATRFWWGSNAKQKKMNWCTWRQLCKPKSEGGLGFCDLETFSRALLAKQGWRILKGCYFRDCSFLEAKKNSMASYVWSSLIWIPIGDGKNPDTMLWHYEANGIYYISSAYMIGRVFRCTFTPNPLKEWWRFFWKMKILTKIKIYLWNACFDRIPTKFNISRRGVNTDGNCINYKTSLETTKLRHICYEWSHRNPVVKGTFTQPPVLCQVATTC
ncbi:hypothetical protein Ddye_013184 [Dipteronia dyeriana]|uniref:Reverse transcriptase zinc-binding domain-containing protein n=1 Tax=Dipteronia dyeriana TaxID=168575 RepID=A0AAD9X5T1_9ROSI|nr:hypothetical protein Ddye_013184 [Dipteronia dyeriana]